MRSIQSKRKKFVSTHRKPGSLRGRKLGSFESLEPRRMLATFVVSSDADSGPDTLRQAILDANNLAGHDRIEFSLPTDSTAIQLQTRLPNLLDAVDIDATTQTGFTDSPIVELDGSQIPTSESASGFTIDAVDVRIAGVVIHSFATAGIRIIGGSGALIEQNFIGVDRSGLLARGNGFAGVLLTDSGENQIGTPGKGNLISGNQGEGIRIEGSLATSNQVQSNKIGVSVLGDQALPNSRDGVLIQNGASQNVVGTDGNGVSDDLDGNLISGNQMSGVRIYGANDNAVAGNYIGTDATGSFSIPNERYGVLADLGSSFNLIGSNGDGLSDEDERNLVSGNLDDGISLREQAIGNVVSGNYVGTDLSGSTAIPNARAGIAIATQSSQNLIGTQDGNYLGNLVSGNTLSGIWVGLSSFENSVSGNVVGLDAAGIAALGNTRGIVIAFEGQRNLIGTNDNGISDVEERNVISGNAQQGVMINGLGADDNIVAGNYIGTDTSGMSSVSNTSTGVLITTNAQGNVVGTTASSREGSAAGNLLSGNQFWGLRFRLGASMNHAGGNWIGVDATGASAIPNQAGGVSSFEGAMNNVVGGTTPIERNVISGNAEWGIWLQQDSGFNEILGNWIGLAVDGNSPIGNAQGGILITENQGNRIGNSNGTGANIVAHNGARGISIDGVTATQNTIYENSIYGHTLLGVDLGSDGVTANDLGDSDTGPNDLLNHPEVVLVARSDTGTLVVGKIDGLPEDAHSVDVYLASEDLFPQGRDYLGRVQTATDRDGVAYWSLEFPPIAVNEEVAARAHNQDNSSELSAAQQSVPRVPLRLTSGVDSYNEDAGQVSLTISRVDTPIEQPISFSVQVSQPLEATLISETVTIPAGLTETEFFVDIVDDSIVEIDRSLFVIANRIGDVAAGAVSLLVLDNDQEAWHNSFAPNDVNGDRFVSAIDALMVINFLNTDSDTDLVGRPPMMPSVFVDVNNDATVSPLDALLVINYLNQGGSAEGEILESGQESYFGGLIELLAEERRRLAVGF